MFYTPLPELWRLFKQVIFTSQSDSEGLVTLSSMESVLNFNDATINVSYDDFWDAMQYFLNCFNTAILERRKKNANTGKNSSRR